MKVTTFTRIKALLSGALGALLALQPNWFFVWFAMPLDAAGEVVARLLGLLVLGISFSLWRVSSPTDLSAKDCRIYALTDAIAAGVLSMAVQQGVMNTLGLVVVAIYLSSSLGFIYSRKQLI